MTLDESVAYALETSIDALAPHDHVGLPGERSTGPIAFPASSGGAGGPCRSGVDAR